jgi:DNA-binding transcriptional LysR family regulator
MLDVVKLATLREVIARGSFSRAGAALHLTQPAVSRQIAQLEAQLGTQLVRRTRHGVHATEAGQLLADHADAVIDRLALAEAQVGELSGLRRGRVRLGSFFTALVYLSAELAGVLEARHPDLFRLQPDVIADELVDRTAAMRGLASGDLDVAIVFEHGFEPAPAPDDVELVHLFDDPLRVLLPRSHAFAKAKAVHVRDLGTDAWIRAHRGSSARLVDRVLRDAGIEPRILQAGHGAEPVEAQAFVAAGRGVTVAYDLNVVLDPERIAVVPLAGRPPVRHVQAAIMRGQNAPAPRAVLDALREVGERRAQRLARRRACARRGARPAKRGPTGSPGAA